MKIANLRVFPVLILCLASAAQAHVATHKATPAAPVFTAAATNDATQKPILTSASLSGSAVLRAQILLDRAHFSPGEIDGRYGSNSRLAVSAFNESRKIAGGASVTVATWDALNQDTAPAIVQYTITAEDHVGPYLSIPSEIPDKAKLPFLGYESLPEALGERFHISPKLLRTLNPGIAFETVGAIIAVPNVVRQPLAKTPGMSIRVSRHRATVEAINPAGAVLASYPATLGSAHDPLPIGKWKINGVEWNPSFHYNPDLFWDAEAGDKKTKLPAGPNNPVGVVWIDLSKPHYGIHGTPEPSTIGKTTSHGCIRLTNWDAAELAGLVTPGTPA